MKKSILTIAGSALIVLSTVQFAAATEHHQGKVQHRTSARDSNAYAPPAYDAVQPQGYPYSGGFSAPAGR